MAAPAPLSTLLSQALIAFTIELDNEFERRFEEAGGGARVASFAMWSNLLRFVGAGITVGELTASSGLQKPRVLATLGGVERWRYVYVAPTLDSRPPADKRDGYGSARGLKDGSVVRLTPAGRRAAAVWPALPGEVEGRWRERFEAGAIDELEGALRAVVEQLDVALPEFLPIVGGSNGMALELPATQERSPCADAALVTLLAQVLFAYTVDFEHGSELSLPVSANVLRVLHDTGLRVGELPALAGISKEAVAMALTFLGKTPYVALAGISPATKTIRLTAAGETLQTNLRTLHARIAKRWETRFGADVVRRLRSSLGQVVGHRHLAAGLRPPAGGWRATAPYAAQTEALLADPRAALPHYPMVLHRGGWPDGS